MKRQENKNDYHEYKQKQKETKNLIWKAKRKK